MKEDMLQRLHTLAVEHQLGEQYTRITSLPQGLSRLGILATGVGLVLLVGLAFLTPFLLTLLSSWQMLLLLSLALTWIGTGLWLLLAPMHTPTSIEALLYTDGIVWKRRTTTEVLRWQDIESLWRAPTNTKKPHYAVHLYDERIISFDVRSPGAKKLVRILEWEMTCLHFAPLLKKFCQEQSLTFGPLCVNTQGISYNQKCLA